MTGRLRNEGGWTLIELLVAMTLMLIVLSATLTSFNAFSNNARRSTQFNDQQDRARNVMDQIVRQARNLANPTTGTTGVPISTIAFADENNLVFQTTDPQKQWVRYCLDTSTQGSTTARESIWYQTTTNSTISSSDTDTSCPLMGGAWQKSTQVADYVTNATTSGRPLFSYFSKTGPMPTLPVPAADTTKIVRVALSVFLKLDPNRAPAETQLASAAFMRNQNQAPVASFETDVAGTTYTFDGGASFDPEGRTLDYNWYAAPADPGLVVPSPPSVLPDCSAKTPDFSGAPGWGCLGTTVVLTKSITTPTYVFLRVTDPGNLQAMTAFSPGGCLKVTDPGRVPTDCGGAALP